MEEVFRALADETRRRLLDRLYRRDGQTLSELVEGSGMTRFGVMKHLRVLEDAGLVTTRRSGRTKLHFLNPVPIRLIHDRWISKFAEPWVGSMAELKFKLESPAVSAPEHVYEVYIRTTPEALWDALTNPDETEKYYYGARLASDLVPGGRFDYTGPDGNPMLRGECLEVEPGRKLVTTFQAGFNEEAEPEPPSRVTFLIEPMGDVCKLTLVHDQLERSPNTSEAVGTGWNPVLSGLKTLLETGDPLRVPMS